ncbi:MULTISPECIES: hypothetical protein [Trichocoleus]|uniref:Uncharacterized protein n=1 Tax=Trichocoleus desertorum GB2-A4 TaxID=2933944 RepID=A0ABV0JCM7_9CYAN|nr:hypothetical protein [Trichocoleus sp. FACHB-46]MBD1864198.1 hypothetical protein [Trichocoleus sp. FACHB-46]
MSDCYCTLRDDIPTPLDNLRHLFELNRIPVVTPVPTALVDEQPCYEIDAQRLTEAQVQALAENLCQKYKDHPELPSLEAAIAVVQEGLPIGKQWVAGVGGGAQSAATLMDFDEDWFSGSFQALEWFEAGDEEPPDFGACCACRQEGSTVRNFVSLTKRALVPGTGWGCIVCNLPSDGALAVICDECLAKSAEIQDTCHGYAATKERSPLAALTEDFDHDHALHEAEIAAFVGAAHDS